MRRFMGLVLVVALIMALFSGCSSEGEISTVTEKAAETQTSNDTSKTSQDNSGAPKKIGVLIGSFSDQFQSYIMQGVETAAAELGDSYEVTMYDGKYDQNQQLSQVENLISEGVDAVCVVAVDKDASAKMIETLDAEGIPIVSISNYLSNQELAESFVGSDNVIAGRVEMQAVADALNGSGNIVVLEGAYGHDAQRGRRQGYDEILANYPDIKIVAENTGNWARAEGMQVVENWLNSDIADQIDAVVCENDEMAIGAMKAVTDAGLIDKIVIGGVDATPECIEYLKTGDIEITVFQDGVGQGKTAVLTAAKLIQGESVDAIIDIPFELVSADTADMYLEKYGK